MYNIVFKINTTYSILYYNLVMMAIQYWRVYGARKMRMEKLWGASGFLTMFPHALS